jgi:hypothetical protein
VSQLLRRRHRLGGSRLIPRGFRLGYGVGEIGSDPGCKGARCFGEQPLELDAGVSLELFLLRLNPGAKLFQRLGRQPSVSGREIFQHVQIVEVAKRLAKIVEGFGLRVQRLWPSRSKARRPRRCACR